MIVLLDMDGCICDWTKQVCKVLNRDYEKLIQNWTKGVYDTAEQLEVSDAKMWIEINKNPTFWEDIEPYDYAHDLVKQLRKNHEVYICSSPSIDSGCLKGKSAWLVNHKFKFGRNFIFTPQKHLLAQPGRVLIDDLDKNANKFEEFGGKTCLLPQPWNSNYALRNVDKVKYVMEQLELINGN